MIGARFNALLDKLSESLDSGGSAVSQEARQANEQVVAVLLVEIARSNHEIDDSERRAIADALGRATELSEEAIEALFDDAMREADLSVSLHEHVRVINERFSREQKVALLEDMWRVAIADGRIDHHEEYTVRKLSDLLHLKHRDFMQSKLAVMNESPGDD